MPSLPKAGVDWDQTRIEYERGILPKAQIARMAGVKKQSLAERAIKEGWIYGKETGELGEQGEGLPSLEECIGEVTRYSDLAQSLPSKSIDQQRQITASTPDNLGRALYAAYRGARQKVMADAAGISESTLSNVLRDDVGFGGVVKRAHAFHALESLTELRKAQKRGDVGAARTLLEKGPYSEEYGSGSGPGGVSITVALNISDPLLAQPDAILDISPTNKDIT